MLTSEYRAVSRESNKACATQAPCGISQRGQWLLFAWPRTCLIGVVSVMILRVKHRHGLHAVSILNGAIECFPD